MIKGLFVYLSYLPNVLTISFLSSGYVKCSGSADGHNCLGKVIGFSVKIKKNGKSLGDGWQNFCDGCNWLVKIYVRFSFLHYQLEQLSEHIQGLLIVFIVEITHDLTKKNPTRIVI